MTGEECGCYDWQEAFSILARIFLNKETMTKVLGTVEDNFEWEVNRKKEKKKQN